MKKEIALQLADAITSGHYDRGSGRNRTKDNKFCIGGVLINLFAQAHPALAAMETDPLKFMGTNYSLPRAVMKWADVECYNMTTRDRRPLGLKKYVGMIRPTGLQYANDACGLDRPFLYSWEEIAAWLRTGKNHTRI